MRETRRSSAKPRHRWIGVAQAVAVAAISVGALAAIYAERSTMRESLVTMRHAGAGWLLTGFSVELVSMVALAQLERSLLAGRRGQAHAALGAGHGVHLQRDLSLGAIKIGSSIATAYAYRDFRRAGPGRSTLAWP